MKLTELQEILLDALKSTKIEEKAIIGIMLIFKEENRKTEEMIQWIIDNPTATQTQIMKQAVEISQSV